VTAAAWLIVSGSTYLAVLIKSEEEDGRNDGVGRKNALLGHRHHRTTRRPAARVRGRDQMKLCLSPDDSCRPSTCDASICAILSVAEHTVTVTATRTMFRFCVPGPLGSLGVQREGRRVAECGLLRLGKSTSCPSPRVSHRHTRESIRWTSMAGHLDVSW